MPRASDAARRAAEAWRLAWVPAPPRGRAGEHLGRGTGSSLEFQDRRLYQAGDDVRHLDWRALARTGELSVKLYREEVLPRLDLVVDTSASMGVGQAKPGLHADLALFLALVARRAGLSVRVVLLDDRPRVLELERLEAEGLELTARQPLSITLPAALGLLRPGTLRVLVSDFLSPHDPGALVRSLARGAGGLGLLQVLDPEDAHPEVGSSRRLVDAETGEALELVLEARVVEDYLARLGRLTDDLDDECRRLGARFVPLEAGAPLDEHLRGALSAAGLVLPG